MTNVIFLICSIFNLFGILQVVSFLIATVTILLNNYVVLLFVVKIVSHFGNLLIA